MSVPTKVKAHYKLDGNANDLSGNGHHASTTNCTYSTTIKKYGTHSLTNGGVGNRPVTLPASLENALSSCTKWSAIFWVRPAQPSASFQNDIIMFKGDGFPWATYDIWTGFKNFTSDSTSLDFIFGGASMVGNWTGTSREEWHRFNFEYDGTQSKGFLYIDGVLKGTATGVNTNPMQNNSGYLFCLLDTIYHDSGNAPKGYIDQVMFTDTCEEGGEVFENSEPTITDIDPSTGSFIGGQSVTITGTQFAAGVTVLFDTTSATNVVVVSATEITCTAPAHAVGAVDVTVTNTDTGTYTLTDGFTYTSPTITGISPDTTPVFTTPDVTITGTNFVTGATITFNSIPATNVVVVNSTTITCTVPSMNAASLAVVTVTNPDGGYFNETTLFTFTMSSPTITDISPAAATVYATPSITITGTDFVAGATIIIGNVAATNVTVVNSTTITCTVPARNIAAQVNVKITNTDTGTVTAQTAFEYLAPTITSVAPEIGSAAGGEEITITGTGFHNGVSVLIGGVAATEVTVVNSTTITCLTPEHADGEVDIIITDPELIKYELSIGTEGSGDGQLNNPYDVRILPSGHVLVSDMYNERIQKFDAEGNYISQFGTYGSGNGEFNAPCGMATDSAGNIFVADVAPGPYPFINNIQKFNSSGTFVLKFGGNGSGNGQFNVAYSVAVNSQGYIFVVDWGNNRVQKFTAAGAYVSQFGTLGTGNGQFDQPEFIFIDGSDNMYIGDLDNSRVQKFDSAGNYIMKFGTYGSGPGQLSTGVGGITLDAQGNIYVVDSLNNRVEKFDSAGNFILQFGTYGEGTGQFIMPNGIDTDTQGNIYVVDSLNARVQKFTNTYTITNAFNFVTFSSTPAQGGLNGGTFLTITGDFFVEGMTVAINGDPCYAVVVNDAQTITAQSPVGNIAVGLPVTITYPDGGPTIEVGFFSYSDDAYVDSEPIFEKNKLYSTGVVLELLEITGEGISSTIRLVRNTEDITWNGNIYRAFPFILGSTAKNTNNEIPNFQIQVNNVTREIQAILEETDGAAGTTIKVITIHTDHAEALWEGVYSVQSTSCDQDWVTFSCGLEYPTTKRVPVEAFQKYMCRFQYGDIRCSVADAVKVTYPACGKTIEECKLRSNDSRFGGELNIPGVYFA